MLGGEGASACCLPTAKLDARGVLKKGYCSSCRPSGGGGGGQKRADAIEFIEVQEEGPPTSAHGKGLRRLRDRALAGSPVRSAWGSG